MEGTEGAGGVKVGVLDSGVSFTDDLDVAENMDLAGGEDDVNPMFEDATGHGTGIAGMIGALDNEDGIRGINPDAEICSIRILDENNQTTLSKAVAGIYQAIESDCDILNMSFGTEVNSPVLYEAVRSAYDAGMLLVAAGGNQAGKAVEYPAAYPEVMAVGATDASGNWMTNTCDGPEIEIYAPGSQIPTSGLFGGTAIVEGTSIAAAQVTGAASLLWAKDRTKDVAFIRNLLVSTTQYVENTGISGAGLLDIENAVEMYQIMSDNDEDNAYENIEMQRRESEIFEDIELINGSWLGVDHMSMAENATQSESIDSRYIQLLAISAKKPDAKPYDSAKMIHATGNYVLALKFIYKCANYLRAGKSVDAAVNAAAADTGIPGNKHIERRKELMKQMKAMLKAVFLDAELENTAMGRYYKALGIGMHLIGDTHAHRTIVPKYTVAGTNPKNRIDSKNSMSENARFGSADFKSGGSLHSDKQLKEWASASAANKDNICKNWKCFQRTVNLGVMEFKDVKNFGLAGKADAKFYEDNRNFCKERYVAAEESCEYFFDSSFDKDRFEGQIILFPTEPNVKLNNLKGYLIEAGEKVSLWTNAEWNEASTPSYY